MPRAGKTPLTPELHKQTLTFAGAVLSQLPFLSVEEQQRYIGNPSLLARRLRDVLVEKKEPLAENPDDLARWTSVYQKYFGQTPHLSSLMIPSKPEGLGLMRLIVVAKEIVDWTSGHPLQGTQNALKKRFACWQYWVDLDEAITQNDRDPKNGTYALWVRDVRDADDEYAGIPHDENPCLTILERQLLEMDYFEGRGEHTDKNVRTLCTGSRYRNGGYPIVGWDRHGFGISDGNSLTPGEGLRSRSVTL